MRTLALAVIASLGVGCTTSNELKGGGNASVVCEAGQQEECGCGQGVTGYQICLTSGTGWAACVCGDAGPGNGTGGIGGSGGVSGSGGTTSAGGSAGSGGASGSSGAAGTGGSVAECTGAHPAAQVALPAGFSIDSTEVTRCQYQAWLETNPPLYGQPASCAWNTDYTPQCEWPPLGKGQHPVVCVDWCDANAYCRGVGKRLCGRIGGGANGFDDHHDATLSEWLNACSSAGSNDYPYGDQYVWDACNGYEMDLQATVPVSSMPECQPSTAGYAGVYDLLGNVQEWEDSCTDDSHACQNCCRTRGGNWLATALNKCQKVEAVYVYNRASQDASTGFRCCSSP